MSKLIAIALFLGVFAIPSASAEPGCNPGEWCGKTVEARAYDRVDCDGGVQCTWERKDNGNLRITADGAQSHTYYVVNTPGASTGYFNGVELKEFHVTADSYDNCIAGNVQASATLTAPGKTTIHLDFNRFQEQNRKCVVSHFILRWRHML